MNNLIMANEIIRLILGIGLGVVVWTLALLIINIYRGLGN